MLLNDVMVELGAEIASVTGLRTFDYPPGSATPPCAIVGYPEIITFDESYGRGMDEIRIPIVVCVSRPTDRATRPIISEYASGSGTKSIKANLETGSYTSFSCIHVESCEFDVYTLGGTEYLAAIFSVVIRGKGA